MEKQKLILLQLILIIYIFVIKIKAFAYEAPSRCINPNGRAGLCVSIYDCHTLLNHLKTLQASVTVFVRKSECLTNDQGRRPYVCCTSDTGFTSRNDRIVFPRDTDDNENHHIQYNQTSTTARTPRRNENYKTSDVSLFPKPPDCGPVAIGNKIYGGEEAEFGEFPWLANLEYKSHSGGLESVCAGNIINQKYILTAAHCVIGEIEIKVGQLVSVRVGVHNTEIPVDCDNKGCLDAFQRFAVAKTTVHSSFGSSSIYRNYNDIALIRIVGNIQYSFSVAPVCLPDVFPQVPQLKRGIKLTVAGWGHTGSARYSTVKRKVVLPYVENELCPLEVAPEQLCAGGEYRRDSCTGDSGGGLARLVGGAWTVEGIVSYGRGCGLERPGVYTRVRSYIDWIHANVQ